VAPPHAQEIPRDLRDYRADETLRDGGPIRIRAILPADKLRLLEHFRSLSPRSVYFRFMGEHRKLTEDELAKFTELDFETHVGLAATLGDGAAERFIGVGRYIRGADPARAEVAFAVLDAHQGRGIGTLLLHHLGRIARSRGVAEFEASVLGSNRQMLDVFEQSGFKVRHTFESGVVRFHMRLDGGGGPEPG
jgi:GNAT superfamily N-acetyltransferase